MRIAKLSINGIEPAIAKSIPPTREGGGPYYYFSHGNIGRCRWEVRVPLNNSDYPVAKVNSKIELLDDDYGLSILDRKKDIHGNPHLVVRRGISDNKYLILWDLSPGLGGTAYYKVVGDARVLSWGITSEADGSKRGQSHCPVVMVDGPSELIWYRDGTVHGQQRAWKAVYGGGRWSIAPMSDDWIKVHDDLVAMSNANE